MKRIILNMDEYIKGFVNNRGTFYSIMNFDKITGEVYSFYCSSYCNRCDLTQRMSLELNDMIESSGILLMRYNQYY